MASLSLLRFGLVLLGFVVVVHSAPFINEPNDEPTDLEIKEILNYLLRAHPADKLKELDGVTTEDTEGEAWNERWSPMYGEKTSGMDFAETTDLETNFGENVEETESRDGDKGEVNQMKTGTEVEDSKLEEQKESITDSQGPAAAITGLISEETDKAQDTNVAPKQVSKNGPGVHGTFADFLKAQLAKNEDQKPEGLEDEDLDATDLEDSGKSRADEEDLSEEMGRLDNEEMEEWGKPDKELEGLANAKELSEGNDVGISTDDVKNEGTAEQESNKAPLDLQHLETDDLVEEEQILDQALMWDKTQLSKQLQSVAGAAKDLEHQIEDKVDDTIAEEEIVDKEEEDLEIADVAVGGEQTGEEAEQELKQALTEKVASDKTSDIGAKEDGDAVEKAKAETEELKQDVSADEKTSESVEETKVQVSVPVQNQDKIEDVSDQDAAQAVEDKDTNAKSETGLEDAKQSVDKVGTSDIVLGAPSLAKTDTSDQTEETSGSDLTQEADVKTNAKSESGKEVTQQISKPSDQQVDHQQQGDDAEASLKQTGDADETDKSQSDQSSTAYQAAKDHEIVSQLTQFLKKMSKELQLGAANEGQAGQSTGYNLDKMLSGESKTSPLEIETGVAQDSADQNDNMGKAAGTEVQSQENGATKETQDETSAIAANAASVSQEEDTNDMQHHQLADSEKVADAGDNSIASDKEVDVNTKVESAEIQSEVKSDEASLDASHITELIDEKVAKENTQVSSDTDAIAPEATEHHDTINEFSDDTNTAVKGENNLNIAEKTDVVGVDTMSENAEAPETVDVVEVADSASKAKSPGDTLTEVDVTEDNNHQHPSDVGVQVSEDEPQVEEEDKAKTTLEGNDLGAVDKGTSDSAKVEVDSTSLTGEAQEKGKIDAKTEGEETEVLPVNEKASSSDEGEEINKEGEKEMSGKNQEEKLEASGEDKATGDVLEKEVSSGKENQANDLEASEAKLAEVQETEEGKVEDVNPGSSPVVEASGVPAETAKEKDTMDAAERAVANGNNLADNLEDQGVAELEEQPTFEGEDKIEVAVDTDLGKTGGVSDKSDFADPDPLDAYEFASCELPYTPLAVSKHVAGQIVFKQKKTGGPMDIKAGFYSLETEGHVEYTIDVHEYGDLSNGCQATGKKYAGDGSSEIGQTTSIGDAGVLGTAQRAETGSVRLAWTADAAGLVGDNSILGRAVVVHAVGYDSSQSPEGTGPKLACCVVARSSDVTPWI